MFFAVLKPDKTSLGAYASQRDAQDAIALVEPDIIEQGRYQIHQIQDPADAARLSLKVQVKWKLEKFDGEYLGQAPTEVLEGEFDGTH
jgi:hypothetical protein